MGGAGRRQGGVRRTAPGGVDRAGERPHVEALGRPLEGGGVGRGQRGDLDARSAGLLPRREDPHQPVLVDEGLGVGDRRRARAAAEEHPVQRRVGRVALGGGVPRDHLRLRPCHRDVEQPQRLARVLAPVPAQRLAVERARPTDVAAASSLVVVEERAPPARGRCNGSRGWGGRRRGTAGPCCRGSSRAGRPRRRSRGGGSARRRPRACRRRPARAARPAARPGRAAPRSPPGAATRRCGAGRSACARLRPATSTRAVSPCDRRRPRPPPPPRAG